MPEVYAELNPVMQRHGYRADSLLEVFTAAQSMGSGLKHKHQSKQAKIHKKPDEFIASTNNSPKDYLSIRVRTKTLGNQYK